MKLDPTVDLSEAKAITLAGVEYCIPPLALRQLRKVVPALIRLRPVLGRFDGDFSLLTEDVFDDSFEVVRFALTRAYPDATADEVLNLRITPEELLTAIAVIAPLTGLFAAKKPDEPPPAIPPGEAQGTTTTSPIST